MRWYVLASAVCITACASPEMIQGEGLLLSPVIKVLGNNNN